MARPRRTSAHAVRIAVLAAALLVALTACHGHGHGHGNGHGWSTLLHRLHHPTDADHPAGADAEVNTRPTDVTPSPRATCPSQPTVQVKTAGQLVDALDAAAPGEVIQVADGEYDGNFVASAEADPEHPIYLCGGPDAVLKGDGPKGGYVLHLDGATGWRVLGLTISDGQKGVMVDGGQNNVLQNLVVEHIGDEGIHLRTHSSDNLVLDNQVHDTGLRNPKFGEGIYVGSAESNWCEYTDCEPDRSDRNVVEGNTIEAVTSEAVDIKEGTLDGVLFGNTFDGADIHGKPDSWVDVKGNDWLIVGNHGTTSPNDGFQVHEILDGWGTGNVFAQNTAQVDGPGFGFSIHGDEDGNSVRCDNQVTDADAGFANVDCR